MTSNLTTRQDEILNILQEECGEVVQIISKIRRFGIYSDYSGITNRDQLATELGDLQAMINLAIDSDIVTELDVRDAATRKLGKLMRFSTIFDEDETL